MTPEAFNERLDALVHTVIEKAAHEGARETSHATVFRKIHTRTEAAIRELLAEGIGTQEDLEKYLRLGSMVALEAAMSRNEYRRKLCVVFGITKEES